MYVEVFSLIVMSDKHSSDEIGHEIKISCGHFLLTAQFKGLLSVTGMGTDYW